MRWIVGQNSRTSLYEVHAEGCMHSIHPAFAHGFATVEADTAEAAAKDFEANNDGVLTKLGPCTKRRKT